MPIISGTRDIKLEARKGKTIEVKTMMAANLKFKIVNE
jgi:hypothetical protein